MKRTLKVLALGIGILSTACGDAGIGFNISKKIPITFDIFIQGNDPGIEINPPTFSETFRLSDVESFEDVLSDIPGEDGIVVNSITYAIVDISGEEEVPVEQITLSVQGGSASPITILDITGTLQNIPETSAGIESEDTEQVKTILKNLKEVENILVFNFAEVPANDLDFAFVLYYDITLRVRF